MSKKCAKIHKLFNRRERFHFPFNKKSIPLNGIYILFEKGESAHDADRIVRIGTHRGVNKLFSRLNEHFVKENKDRSIFRKNIGRAILKRDSDPYLEIWERKLTSKKQKQKYGHLLDPVRQKEIEREVTHYIRDSFSFCVFQVDEKEKRIKLESKIISTVSLCGECGPSTGWLGLHSPKGKIRESGLWLVNELYKEPLTEKEINDLDLE